MPSPDYAAYDAVRLYFDLVRGALGDLVDGVHFFDIVADDVVYEVLYDFPGWPRGPNHSLGQSRYAAGVTSGHPA